MIVLGQQVEISLERILFATDFTRTAEKAGLYVKAIAEHYGSKVKLVHVVDLSAAFDAPDAGICIDIFRQYGRDHLNAAKARLTSSSIESEGILSEGIDPAHEILRLAKEKSVGLIVTGTRGPGGLGRLAFGSVAEYLIHHAECPVLTVGPAAQPPAPDGKFQRIVYATDFSSEAARAAVYAMSLARVNGGQVFLCHVLPEADRKQHANSEELTERFAAMLQCQVPDIARDWCDPECIVEYGYAADGILLLAYRVNADLIVLGTRRLSHWFDRLKAGVAFEVVRQATCPVLTVRG